MPVLCVQQQTRSFYAQPHRTPLGSCSILCSFSFQGSWSLHLYAVQVGSERQDRKTPGHLAKSDVLLLSGSRGPPAPPTILGDSAVFAQEQSQGAATFMQRGRGLSQEAVSKS